MFISYSFLIERNLEGLDFNANPYCFFSGKSSDRFLIEEIEIVCYHLCVPYTVIVLTAIVKVIMCGDSRLAVYIAASKAILMHSLDKTSSLIHSCDRGALLRIRSSIKTSLFASRLKS